MTLRVPLEQYAHGSVQLAPACAAKRGTLMLAQAEAVSLVLTTVALPRVPLKSTPSIATRGCRVQAPGEQL